MIRIIAVERIPEVVEGDDLGGLIAARCTLMEGDVVVVTQKIVSKAEGRVVALDPADLAASRAAVIASETERVVARRGDVIIAQTRHGLVCANAGVDESNVGEGYVSLLPLDPDRSAAAIRSRLLALSGVGVAVIVSDTFGRAWRVGQTNVAIGVAGMQPLRDHVGDHDAHGRVLHATIIAIADEIAGAAELVMGKSDQIPVAIVRGVSGAAGRGNAAMLIRDAADDLFRTGATFEPRVPRRP